MQQHVEKQEEQYLVVGLAEWLLWPVILAVQLWVFPRVNELVVATRGLMSLLPQEAFKGAAAAMYRAALLHHAQFSTVRKSPAGSSGAQ